MVFAAFAALTFGTSAAFAETYVGVGIAQNQTSIENFDLADGTALDVTVGQSIELPVVGDVRVEGSVARLTSETNIVGLTLNTEAYEYSASAFYDLPVPADWSVRPYVGGGFNWTDGEADVLFTSIDVSGPGYSLGAGARTRLSDNATLDVGVRFNRKDLELEAFGSSVDVDEEETRLRAAVNFAL